MASEKPTSPARAEAHEPDDHSIKARKTQLFEQRETAEVGAVKPFAEYVRLTPPAPMTRGVKAALWGVGVLVALLLLSALFRGRSARPRRSTSRPPRAVAPFLAASPRAAFGPPAGPAA